VLVEPAGTASGVVTTTADTSGGTSSRPARSGGASVGFRWA